MSAVMIPSFKAVRCSGGTREDADAGHGDDRSRFQFVHQGKAFQDGFPGFSRTAEEDVVGKVHLRARGRDAMPSGHHRR